MDKQMNRLRSEHLVVDSKLEAFFKVHDWLKKVCTSLDPDAAWVKHYVNRLDIAVAEGVSNAVRHAHATLPPETPIAIDISLDGDRVDICIWDQGGPFDPSELREPEPGSLRHGGYGWVLLRRVVDRVTYHRENNRNCLEITQHRPV